jgi:hypothetical protein
MDIYVGTVKCCFFNKVYKLIRNIPLLFTELKKPKKSMQHLFLQDIRNLKGQSHEIFL